MFVYQILSALSLAAALLTAHPLGERLVARDSTSITTIERASYSYQQVTQEFRSILGLINSRTITASEARTRIERITHTTSDFFQNINNCASCYSGSSATVASSYVSQVYSSLISLYNACGVVYPQNRNTVLEPITGLDPLLSQNLRKLSGNGVKADAFLPTQFPLDMSKLGLSQTSNLAHSLRAGH